jgi:hypothetical protein
MRERGIPVFPIPYRSKKPVCSWKRYQTELPIEDEVKAWFAYSPSNYAIVTGSLSGLVAIDCDSEETVGEIEKKYPTPWVQRTSRGKQFFYQHPGGSIPNKAHLNGVPLDIRGDGGYVVGPHSVHPSGAVYTIENSWTGTPKDLPLFPMEILKSHKPPKSPAAVISSNHSELIERASRYLNATPAPIEGEGSDHQTYRVLCRLMGRGKDDMGLTAEAVLPVLEQWQPSFDREWWLQKIASVGAYAQTRNQCRTPANPSPMLCMKDVTAKAVSWLWKPRIPIGNITMLEGDPGIGKGFVLARIAADVSRGTNGFQLGNVLWLEGEDDPEDTIKPRLMAANAECGAIHVMPKPPYLDTPEGNRELQQRIDETNAALVIISPLFGSVSGKTSTIADNEIREVLTPLRDIASEKQIAILAIRHLNKTGKEKAIYRGSGSMAITGAARSVLLAGYSVNDKDQLALVHIKCNVAAKGESLGYKITPCMVGDDIETARLEWTGDSDVQAEDILGSEFKKAVPDKPSVIEQAKSFLIEALKGGPRSAREIESDAGRLDISKRTLARAKNLLGVESAKNGKGGWTWTLPAEILEGQKDRDDQLSAWGF